MEERRIGMLYLENFKRGIMGLFGSGFRRSRAFPLLILLVALIIPGGLWFAHTHAYFHKTKEKIGNKQTVVVSNGPGGRAPIVVSRTASPGSAAPQFVSATVLPGLGLDVLQIDADVPGKGVVPLLVAPTLDELTSDTASRSGPNDLHGAIEVPWAGLLTGLNNVLGTSLMMDFQGNAISVPTDGKGPPMSAEGGLIRATTADSSSQTPAPDGVRFEGTINDTDFDGHWKSKTRVNMQVEVHATTFDLTVSARNAGEEAAPMGIGWHPRFKLASDRAATQLRLPTGSLLEIVDHVRELPTGKILAPGEPYSRFMEAAEPLRNAALDAALVRLKPSAAGTTSAEIHDPAAGYGLRITALSSNMGELRVYTPADGNFVSLGFQTNLDNPLGRSWTPEEPGILILQPGQTLTYKVRLEIFPLTRQ